MVDPLSFRIAYSIFTDAERKISTGNRPEMNYLSIIMVAFWSIFWLKWYLLVLNVLLLILELVPEVRFGIRETILAFWGVSKAIEKLKLACSKDGV